MRERDGYRDIVERLSEYPELLTVTEAAQILGVDRRTVREHFKLKTLGRRKYVSKDHMARWLA